MVTSNPSAVREPGLEFQNLNASLLGENSWCSSK